MDSMSEIGSAVNMWCDLHAYKKTPIINVKKCMILKYVFTVDEFLLKIRQNEREK